ncbi:uncharacterized protein LOC111696726 isoform X2 [Eurytemora carolleeae]|uniref:uncharacterized protein LOC111696726 isoform X2 n=1 Tax=Eurytemora carolleeae TaxID=1294199 RepID=UPI000C793020|nr:uncharacterized protein LOC111696726 isoform X2 [Eurytemora carolleeae]|eukprot:XP_023322204.1 uncharacterized protein LOC111696726 isoform X2 [Eurytemora affinis]
MTSSGRNHKCKQSTAEEQHDVIRRDSHGFGGHVHQPRPQSAQQQSGYGSPAPQAAPVFAKAPAPQSAAPTYAPAQQAAPAAEEPVDLHNKEFCVDVSTYQPVVWVESDGEECNTVFVKKCEDKSENVCADVTETKCKVQPYTECSMGLEPQNFDETKLTAKKFVEKVCETGKRTIPHTKMLPQCKNVTKQNCVTLWETDKNGKQVWAGNEACEPVTWQECKLVPKTVSFIVPEITCNDGQELWYHEPSPSTDVRMTNTFDCQVKHSTACETQTRPDCKTIQWQACREVPVKNCKPKSVHVPTQERLHRKKCLLPDEEKVTPAQEDYGIPAAEPVSSYSG